MAKKLYIFGIGGTGSRVLKSLTMLLASGCKLENDFDTIVPIIIDPDTANGDLNRTKDILKIYQEVRNQVKEPNDFFAQELKTVNELANNSGVISPDHFQFSLNDVGQKTFGEYIGYRTLEDNYKGAKDDKSFTKLLYSEKNLDSNLNVGFKGNPNMGAIVLNQFTDSEDFKRFAQTFNDGDAVFIVNSIFGGTGAAGFPLLLKNLRGNDNIANAAKINDAEIGAITYLPYFAINKQDETDEINSDSFEDKAKIALDYYNRTIIDTNKIDSIYFVGNKGNTNHIDYAVGGQEQKNNAHFLEMAGTLAILDFCKNIGQQTGKTKVKEFGIENDSEFITFGDLNINNQKELVKPLTKFKLFSEYLEKGLGKSLGTSRWTKGKISLVSKNEQSPLTKNYFSSSEYKLQVQRFCNYYKEWLLEMEDNKPGFSPYNTVSWSNALNLIKGQNDNLKKVSFKAIDVENCKLITNISLKSTSDKKHTALIKLFGMSTENVLQNRNLLKEENNG